jgi:hypothetical protein
VADRWIGVLHTKTQDELVEGLRELGYVQGQNLVIERRFSEGRAELFPELAAERWGSSGSARDVKGSGGAPERPERELLATRDVSLTAGPEVATVAGTGTFVSSIGLTLDELQ